MDAIASCAGSRSIVGSASGSEREVVFDVFKAPTRSLRNGLGFLALGA